MRQFFLTIALISSLTNAANCQTKYRYSFNDFKPEAKIYLEKLVQSGGTCSDAGNIALNYLTDSVAIDDLKRMTLAEHPLLRAAAFFALCFKYHDADSTLEHVPATQAQYWRNDSTARRNSGLIDSILLNHLDDSAIISFCRGEWGTTYSYVSDYYLFISKGRTTILKTHLEEAIITNHTYLANSSNNGFIYLLKMRGEVSYKVIKDLAHSWANNALVNGDEYTLIEALSEYKKQEDIPFILFSLMRMGAEQSKSRLFYIAENNPDSAYFRFVDVFYRGFKKAVLKKSYWQYYGEGPYFEVFRGKYLSFLGALAAYKNKRSLDIFNEILHKKIYPKEIFKDDELRWELYNILIKHKDPIYAHVIKTLKKTALAYAKKCCLPAEQVITPFCKGCEYW